MTKKVFTNCFLIKEGMVCLAMKKRGFGMGLWNGTGGKPEINETIEEATKREAKEELGVILSDFQKCGEFHFYLKTEDIDAVMHAFVSYKWKGEPVETEEMRPQWFLFDQVPYDQMWKSDRQYLPYILEGKKVVGNYIFEKEGGEVIEKNIKEVEEF